MVGIVLLNRLAAEVKNPCGDSQSAGKSFSTVAPVFGCEAP